MADFGKLNFQVAFNPTTAFPIDARCYFEGDNALSDAEAAAATAEDVGSKNTVYHYGMKVLVNQNGVYTWYKITTSKTLEIDGSGGDIEFSTDEEVTKILESIYGETSDDIPDIPDDDDNTLSDSDFATDEEVENMLNDIFGVKTLN